MSSDFSENLSPSAIDADHDNRTETTSADVSKPNRFNINPDIDKLKQTVNDMDYISQEAVERITTITGLLLLAMESPAFYSRPSDLYHALRQINFIADGLQNDINVMAEDVGCNFIDNKTDGFWAAHKAFQSNNVVCNYSEGTPLTLDTFPPVVELSSHCVAATSKREVA